MEFKNKSLYCFLIILIVNQIGGILVSHEKYMFFLIVSLIITSSQLLCLRLWHQISNSFIKITLPIISGMSLMFDTSQTSQFIFIQSSIILLVYATLDMDYILLERLSLGISIAFITYCQSTKDVLNLISGLIFAIGIFCIFTILKECRKIEPPLKRQPSDQQLLRGDEIHADGIRTMASSDSLVFDQRLNFLESNTYIDQLLYECQLNRQTFLDDLIVLKIDKHSELKFDKRIKNITLRQLIFEIQELQKKKQDDLVQVGIISTSIHKLDNFIIKLNLGAIITVSFEEVRHWKNFIMKKHSMELMSNIFRSFSHEFGTQLNQIVLYTQLAEDDYNSKANIFEAINKSCQIMQSIVRDLKDYYSIRTKRFKLELSLFNIGNLFNELEAIYSKPAEEKKIRLNFYNNYYGKVFQSDEKRIKQILLNLIQNSFKFTPEGGEISISAENHDQNSIIFSVDDNGCGLTTKEAQRLEQILQQDMYLEEKISDNTAGLGLGCFLSNKLVRKLSPSNYQYHLKFERKDVGVKFYFYVWKYNFEPNMGASIDNQSITIQQVKKNILVQQRYVCNQFRSTDIALLKARSCPIKNQHQQFLYSPPKTQQQDSVIDIQPIEEIQEECHCPSILIVDDEPFNIIALSKIIQQMGYKCDSANSGFQAITKCQNDKHCQYKIILMDINMPGMNGFAASRKIKQLYNNDIQIICCSAFSDLEMKQQAQEAGMMEFLDKPIDRTKLEQLLSDYL